MQYNLRRGQLVYSISFKNIWKVETSLGAYTTFTYPYRIKNCTWIDINMKSRIIPLDKVKLLDILYSEDM